MSEDPKTLKEAIEAEEKRQKPVQKLKSVAFDPPVMIMLGRGPARHSRYEASDPMFAGWEVRAEDQFVIFTNEQQGRMIEIPQSICVVEYAMSCPRCKTFLKLAADPCPKPACTWPKAERRVCPECKSQIPKDKNHCPNPTCRWGWMDPDAKPSIEAAKEAMKEIHSSKKETKQ